MGKWSGQIEVKDKTQVLGQGDRVGVLCWVEKSRGNRCPPNWDALMTGDSHVTCGEKADLNSKLDKLRVTDTLFSSTTSLQASLASNPLLARIGSGKRNEVVGDYELKEISRLENEGLVGYLKTKNGGKST